MNASWPVSSLGILAEFRNGLNYTQEARQNGGLPIVGVKDFQNRSMIDFADLEEVDPDLVSAKDSLLEQNDILFVRSNGNRELIGRSLFVNEQPMRPTTFSGFTIRVRIKDQRAVPRFFSYLLRGPIVRKTLSQHGGGTNISNLNQGILGSLKVPLPPLNQQSRIASILSAYDDLIEVNRRRMATLEEMARRLFEEWFVHFRFPGHETVPVHDTSDGPLPEGWQRAALSTLTSYINRGIAPRYDDTSETLVASQKCVRDGRFSLERARRQSKPVPREKLVQLGDILINSTGAGTLGRVAQVESAASGLTVDSHVTIVRPKLEQDRDFLGSTMIRLQPEFERLGTGSTNQTELSRITIGAMPILSPPSSLREGFGLLVRPARELIATLSKQTICLAAARDLLLPRLISGELSVAEFPAPERLLEAAD